MGTADNIVRPMTTTIKNEIANVLDGDRELFWDMPDRAMSKHPPGISCLSIEDATQFIKQNLEKHLDRKSLLSMSAKLANQIESCCGNDSQSMLPSLINKVPDGTESGQFLCLEIGGSTLRAALVRLYETKGSERQLPEVTGLRSWPITKELKSSKGTAFIRWIAQTTAHMVEESYVSLNDRQSSLRACLTWSFPLQYVLSRMFLGYFI
jgi:hexokinase